MRLVGAALGGVALLAGGGQLAHGSGACPRDPRLGRLAYVRGTVLHLFDLGTCSNRVLVARGASGPVRFVGGGRFVRYGVGWRVPVTGGKPTRVAGESGLRSPDGRLVADVRVERRPGAPTGSQSITVGGRTIYTVRESYRHVPAGAPGPLALFAWSADGRWLLFYIDPMGSESLAADGIQVQAISVRGGRPRPVVGMLRYPDYVTWCGRRLVATAGGDRLATENKWLVLATAPLWHRRTLARSSARAWGSIACAPNGERLVVQSQPVSHDFDFFATHWSLWSVGLDGSKTRLTAPPRGTADESPHWSHDGRSLLFVRSSRGRGRLFLWQAGRIHGPLADLGVSLGYYGHRDWWSAADWWQPKGSRSAAAASTPRKRVAFLHRGNLVVADLATGSSRVVASRVSGAVGLSGDGKLVSVGGRVVGGPTLGKGRLVWAPTGETAAYQTPSGAVFTWNPVGGRRLVVAASWGATSFAWGRDGALALGRAVCHVPCGIPRHEEVWIRRAGSLRRVAGPLAGERRPMVAAVTRDRRALWWSWASASTAADGTRLYANRVHVADSLPYPDYVSVCGSHLAVAAGHDRYAMHGKRILFDGRDVSRDPSRSWVSPSCSSDGRTLVAAASTNTTPLRIGRERRSIWQLLPTRRRLTTPPAGSTDEFPRLLRDGSVLFVRTERNGLGTVELLRGGKLTALGSAGRAANYYGHYDWPDVVAVSP